MKRLITLLAFLIVCLGCASININYIGQSYPPTEHVDLYFSEGDINKNYKVVGRILATANPDEIFFSDEKFIEKILEKAHEKGADGVVILDFGQIVAGTSTSRTETEERQGNQTVIHEYENSGVSEKIRTTALAIKYKSK